MVRKFRPVGGHGGEGSLFDIEVNDYPDLPSDVVVLASDYDALKAAAVGVLDDMDLTCMRANEEISVTEGCPCAVCVLKRLAADGEVKS